MTVRAAVLVTGDEVLGGRVGERNAGYLARSLAHHGIPVVRTLIVGDDLAALEAAVGELLALGVDLLCTTGGLGPTADDLTMAAVAAATGRPLIVDTQALDLVRDRSRLSRRIEVDDERLESMRRKQASLPADSIVLPPAGTAPGALLTHDRTVVIVLPGPPWELEQMWTHSQSIGPLAGLLQTAPGRHEQTMRLWGIIEAELVDALDVLDDRDIARIGTYTRDGELEVVVPDDLATRVHARLAQRFGDALFVADARTVDDLVIDALRREGQTLAVAESCTGGGLGSRLTAVSGSSEWFLGGVIAYADAVKVAMLGVPGDVVAAHGAVSAEVARLMAVGVRQRAGSDWGVSITGVAGPTGGSPEKPVGTVWIGVADPSGASEATQLHRIRGDRDSIRRRAQTGALHRLRIAIGASGSGAPHS